MDPVTERAIADYDKLLRERELSHDLEDHFVERMKSARLTFGGRLLCPFLRPHFVSPATYEQVRNVCRGIFRAIEKVERDLGPKLWDLVDLTPAERDLCAIDPGYARSSPTSRLDSFITTSAFQFVELNAESPAGIAYAEVLMDVFLELPIVQRFQEKWTLTRFEAREALLKTLVDCYREAGGREEHPVIAIVDYEDVPTRTEHHMFRDFFSERGHPAYVCDPRDLTYEDGALRFEGRPIDIVYKRLLVNELLDRIDQLGALMQAARERRVTIVNPFRCKPIHKKAIFAVLTDESLQTGFDADERAAIAAHIPWTRRLVEGRTTHAGTAIDLLPFVRANRDRLVMKPNDEYGGKGVFLGWEMSESLWDTAVAEGLLASYVVQEKVELQRQSFPELAQDGSIRHRDLVIDLDPFVLQGEVKGFLTRLSGTSLANVTSGGGQVPAFLLEPK